MSDDHIDINAAFELAQNTVDAARTAMQAAHKLKELAEALQQATHGGWFPASVPPPRYCMIAGLYFSAGRRPSVRCVSLQGTQWYGESGGHTETPDFWCHLPKGVVS